MLEERVDPRIVDFITKHHVMTLCTSFRDEPWCAQCFYVYLPDRNSFIFSSDTSTRHITDVSHNCYVAGSIVLESKVVGKLQGLQLQGMVTGVRAEDTDSARRAYLRQFPYAVVKDLLLWQLDVALFKYTDNMLGFGKKIHWSGGTSFDELLDALKESLH